MESDRDGAVAPWEDVVKEGRGGFDHYVDDEKLREYRSWPVERKLAWLMAGLKLRQLLPERVRDIQDKFRRGEI